MKQNYGLSLMEVLITLSVVAIITGVGTAQYGKYMSQAECQSLHESAKLFVSSLNSCIKSSGGWNITLLKHDGTPCENTIKTDNCPATYDGTKKHGSNHYPCKALAKKGTTTATNTTGEVSIGSALKKLGYTCPIATEDDDNKCETIVGDKDTSNEDSIAFCLSIKKKISGEKHQIVAIVEVVRNKGPKSHKIYCRKGEYVDLTTSNCKIKEPVYDDWNAGNTDSDSQCEWPAPSKTTGGTSTSTPTTGGTS